MKELTKQERCNNIIREAADVNRRLTTDRRDDTPNDTMITVLELIIRLAAELRDA